MWGLVATLVAGACAVQEDVEIFASDGAAGHEFGRVALSGGAALAGAPASNRAYFFHSTDQGATWSEVDVFTPAGAVDYGLATAMSLPVAVVGAPGSLTDQGTAYTYLTSDGGLSWTETGALTAGDGETLDFFGNSVAAAADLLLIGAYGDDDGGSVAGAAYAYRTTDGGNSFSFVAKLASNSPVADDKFGFAVALSGTVAVISKHGSSSNAGVAEVVLVSNAGATWTYAETLSASDASVFDFFGYAVSVTTSGASAYALIGAWAEDAGSLVDAGSGYVFVSSDSGASWSEAEKLEAPDGVTGDEFAKSVAIAGDVACGGAPERDDIGGASGAVYCWETADAGASWSFWGKMTASDGGAGDRLGISLAADDGLVLAGTQFGDGNSADTGNAYATRVATAGSVGDPVLVDFAGHRFFAGNTADTPVVLLTYERDSLLVVTGRVQGVKQGYFVERVDLIRAGCGQASLKAVQGSRDAAVSGAPCATAAISVGDNGVSVMAIGNGEGIILVVPHLSGTYTFLNVKVLSASDEFKRACQGALCDEEHWFRH